MESKENKIINLLLRIKARPGMFLGTKSLSKLRSFFDGYICAIHENNLNCGEKIYYDFNDWLHEKYGFNNTAFWEHSLVGVSDAEAFDLFFEELSYFLEIIGKYGDNSALVKIIEGGIVD